MDIETLMESMNGEKKFVGVVALQIIENGIIVHHYSPHKKMNVMRHFDDATEMAGYVDSLVALYHQQTAPKPVPNTAN